MDDRQTADVSNLDLVAQVHEVECECGETEDVVNGLCVRCRFCERCEHEFGSDENKNSSGDEGYLCDSCHEDSESDALCGFCNGSGEGMWDGSSCRSCRGSGMARN